MLKKVERKDYNKEKVVLFSRRSENFAKLKNWAEKREFSYISAKFPDVLKGKETCNFLIGFSDKNDNLVIYDFSDLGSSFEHITFTLNNLVKSIKINSIYSFKYELLIEFSKKDITIFFEILNLLKDTEKDIFSYRTATGIAEAKSKGKKVGRPKSEIPLPHPLDNHRDKIIKLLEEGYSVQKLANLFNVTYRQMSYYIFSRNLK